MRGAACLLDQNASDGDSGLDVADGRLSVLLISPQNRILLLQRVKSGSFASAHVFPGGHLSPQDGEIPPVHDVRRHEDSESYRLAAIRECFEESGILLAKYQADPERLVQLSEQDRDEGRKLVHAEALPFRNWLQQKGGIPDIEGLVPFTRWLTPANIPKRFSTQMYLYFLPLDSPLLPGQQATEMHIPTPDGGVEHTTARFAYAQDWIDMARNMEIVLFPPQFFLLSLISPFSSASTDTNEPDIDSLRNQRSRLLHFVETEGEPPWSEKCISPDPIKREKNKYLIMGLANAGPELEGTGRKGDSDRVIRVELDKEIEKGRQRPRPKEVIWRESALGHRQKKGRL